MKFAVAIAIAVAMLVMAHFTSPVKAVLQVSPVVPQQFTDSLGAFFPKNDIINNGFNLIRTYTETNSTNQNGNGDRSDSGDRGSDWNDGLLGAIPKKNDANTQQFLESRSAIEKTIHGNGAPDVVDLMEVEGDASKSVPGPKFATRKKGGHRKMLIEAAPEPSSNGPGN